MGYKEFQLLMIFWKLGLVDTFSVLKLCVNCGSQYMGIVLSSAAGNFSDIGPKVLFEPVLGLGTSYQFVKAAATAAERRKRIATLASFLSASGGALTTDPTTNAAIGAAVASKIGYMKAILARGGGSELAEYFLIPSLKEFAITANQIKNPAMIPLLSPVLNPAQIEFQVNCKIITQNIFREHTARRYAQGLAQKVVKPTLKPINYVRPLAFLASTKVSIPSLIGWSCLWGGITVATIYGTLLIIRDAKNKHYEIICKPNERIIDVTAVDLDYLD